MNSKNGNKTLRVYNRHIVINYTKTETSSTSTRRQTIRTSMMPHFNKRNQAAHILAYKESFYYIPKRAPLYAATRLMTGQSLWFKDIDAGNKSTHAGARAAGRRPAGGLDLLGSP